MIDIATLYEIIKNHPRCQSMIRHRYGYAFLKSVSILCNFILKQKPVIGLIGRNFNPYFERSRSKLEIDITYACNLNCLNCCRFCGSAPSTEKMTVEQIDKFVRESIEEKKKWEIIRILGGEPTLHPDIIPIIEILLNYKNRHMPECRIILYTNGLGRKEDDLLRFASEGLEVMNSAKESIYQSAHKAVNIAPCDLTVYRLADYSTGCPVTSVCGMGLNLFGYYPCAVAGAIDRVMGFDLGRKKIPAENDSMKDLLSVFCRYCGFFIYLGNNANQKKKNISKTWVRAFQEYAEKTPLLMKY